MSNKILIVDDSQAYRKVLSHHISSLAMDIIEAKDGLEGIKIATQQKIDLIISDLNMPNMNGIEFCKKIKLNPSTKSIPIIIHSGFDSESDIERGFKAGASAYFSKNDNLDSLSDTIISILSKKKLIRSRRILVVDDSEVIRKLVETGLQDQGFQVYSVENGLQALKLIKEKPPHLILTDVDMPEMNGFSFCTALRDDNRLATIPILVMSSNNDESRMKRMMSLGAVAYIYKPFNIDELVILIEKIISDQYMLLVNKAEKLESEQKLTLASIASLVNALEARDAYTRGHSDDVAKIVTEMGKLLGMKAQSLERLSIGGKLHDIGKIGVKDSILLKPGNLLKEEMNHIKQHPAIGAAILDPIESLKDIIDIVLHHHERFDGKGYPHKLKGTAIPPWARMVAVADTYNALTSDRPYRKGMPKDKAIQIIKDIKGTQLCPECVDLFLHCANKKIV